MVYFNEDPISVSYVKLFTGIDYRQPARQTDWPTKAFDNIFGRDKIF